MLRSADMAWGVRRAVVDCAGVKPAEQVLIVTDSGFDPQVVEVFATVAAEVGAEVAMTSMSPVKIPGEQPPRTVAAAMREADVILELTTQFIGSSDARVQACKNGARYLILVEMSPYLLRRGGPFEADFDKLKPIAEELQDRFSEAKGLRLTTRAGTDITASLEGRTGRHHAGVARERGVLAAPPDVEAGIGPPEGTTNGILVIDALIELLGLGLIVEPFEVEVRKGRCVRIEGKGDGQRHASAFQRTLDSLNDSNVYEIAEIAVGLNPFATYCSAALECEAVLGSAHIGVGDNRGYGGVNASKGHFDLVMRDATLSLDGEVILENGDLTTTSIRSLMG
ncbi:MAG: aminopeptidase [Nitrospinota bacterium]